MIPSGDYRTRMSSSAISSQIIELSRQIRISKNFGPSYGWKMTFCITSLKMGNIAFLRPKRFSAIFYSRPITLLLAGIWGYIRRHREFLTHIFGQLWRTTSNCTLRTAWTVSALSRTLSTPGRRSSLWNSLCLQIIGCISIFLGLWPHRNLARIIS